MTKYQDSKPYGLRQEDFSMFSLYKPQGHDPQGDATYQISWL